MAILRTIFWVLLTAVLVLFAVNNWTPVEVRIWQTLVLETKLPALAIGAFLLGLGPMWLVHRAAQWRLKRRIASLEASMARSVSLPPVAASTEATPPA